MTHPDGRPRIGVVIHRPLRDQMFAPVDRQRLESLGDVVWAEDERPVTVSAAIDLLRDCDVGVGSWNSPYPSAALLEGCPRLALWEHVAGSVKHMFGSHLDGRNLVIASCKPALADTVAEYTLGQIILALRDFFANAMANRQGIVPKPTRMKMLAGSTIGIVGASLIGRRVIRLLKPFACHILVYDPYLSDAESEPLGVEKTTMESLCARSDVVSLHTPDTEEARNIMGAREFASMRDDAVFINTARGTCVDEAALIAELSRGRLFAILDVTMPEPPAVDSPFRTLPNVVYTSHIAGWPPAYNLGHQAVDDIVAFLSGGSPEYVTTAEMLASTA